MLYRGLLIHEHVNGARMLGSRVRHAAALLAAGVLLSGCTSYGWDNQAEDDLLGYQETPDPFEPVNRAVFQFNRGVDTVLLKPAAQGYDHVPEEYRGVIANFLQHISLPVVLLNDIFQGEWDRAGDAGVRLIANSVVLGLGDLVPERHPYHEEDFGQTLGAHGSGPGFYLVLPVLGPSTARDATGRIVDWALSPTTHIDGTTTFSISTGGLDGVRRRHRALGRLEQLEADSVDFYARMRSLYTQRRDMRIENRGQDR